MTYEVRCACGKANRVSGADAGGRVKCACGQTVEVPPLHELRAAAGEGAGLSPAVRIEALLLAGRLPGTRACAACFEDTDNVVRVRAELERAVEVEDDAPSEQLASGCLFGLFTNLLRRRSAEERHERGPSDGAKRVGRDVSFELPLPVCPACRSKLLAPGALRTALGTVPEYADLLKCHPQAALALL
jgi:hypothetical protein